MKNFGSITEISGKNMPDCDLLVYSFPCQDHQQVENLEWQKDLVHARACCGDRKDIKRITCSKSSSRIFAYGKC